MGASDIHIKPDHEPTIRVSSELFPVPMDVPTTDQVNEIVRFMMPRSLEARARARTRSGLLVL